MRNWQRLLPAISALLCAVLMILLLIDAIWPLANLFLSAFVKLLTLVTGLLAAACGIMLAARERRRVRYGQRARRRETYR